MQGAVIESIVGNDRIVDITFDARIPTKQVRRITNWLRSRQMIGVTSRCKKQVCAQARPGSKASFDKLVSLVFRAVNHMLGKDRSQGEPRAKSSRRAMRRSLKRSLGIGGHTRSRKHARARR